MAAILYFSHLQTFQLPERNQAVLPSEDTANAAAKTKAMFPLCWVCCSMVLLTAKITEMIPN
jgi:hypothetical protein